ncbi:hypothetical protein Heshes_15250 [Alicyclobacillus hesperidum]|uniref:Uncharacterized protein n=1 Tax=Alicyclobacillus hesperidum TaxID=89784 RepID=A0AA37U2D7_9BACL|nr:hypothetical protein [Alicyclobacillus hesperidum]GLV13841.1 hypothetical protein Heshes_15250 [Alicyclobacillus hesperidum]
MYQFPKIKMLRGELKRTEIRNQVKYQLTTKEFIQQRGRTTYRIALEHILGFVECADSEYDRHAKPVYGTKPDRFGKPYKIVANLMYLITESGVIEQSRVSFYTRLSSHFAKQMEILLGSNGS